MASQYQKLPSECCKRVTPTRANLGCLLTKVNFLVGVKFKTLDYRQKKKKEKQRIQNFQSGKFGTHFSTRTVMLKITRKELSTEY